MSSNSIEFGWAARPMKEQHPSLSDDVAAALDADNAAVCRLRMRGLMTDIARDAAFKKLAKVAEKEIRAAIAKATLPTPGGSDE